MVIVIVSNIEHGEKTPIVATRPKGIVSCFHAANAKKREWPSTDVKRDDHVVCPFCPDRCFSSRAR